MRRSTGESRHGEAMACLGIVKHIAWMGEAEGSRRQKRLVNIYI